METDWQVTVEFLSSGRQVVRAKGLIMAKCRDLLRRDWRAKIARIYRKDNMAAD